MSNKQNDIYYENLKERQTEVLEKLREYAALIPKEDRKGYDQCISDYMVLNQRNLYLKI